MEGSESLSWGSRCLQHQYGRLFISKASFKSGLRGICNDLYNLWLAEQFKRLIATPQELSSPQRTFSADAWDGFKDRKSLAKTMFVIYWLENSGVEVVAIRGVTEELGFVGVKVAERWS